MAACQVDGVSVLICQVEGRYYALHNECSHARQALHAGALRGHEVRCPLHGGRFDVRTGDCLGPPASKAVTSFPVQLEGGRVHVDVSGADRRQPPRFGQII